MADDVGRCPYEANREALFARARLQTARTWCLVARTRYHGARSGPALGAGDIDPRLVGAGEEGRRSRLLVGMRLVGGRLEEGVDVVVELEVRLGFLHGLLLGEDLGPPAVLEELAGALVCVHCGAGAPQYRVGVRYSRLRGYGS
jgi:hypothetical protein